MINDFSGRVKTQLAPVLAKMTALKELWLNENQIDAKACEHLAPALAQMTALGKEMMREAWKKAGKYKSYLYI